MRSTARQPSFMIISDGRIVEPFREALHGRFPSSTFVLCSVSGVMQMYALHAIVDVGETNHRLGTHTRAWHGCEPRINSNALLWFHAPRRQKETSTTFVATRVTEQNDFHRDGPTAYWMTPKCGQEAPRALYTSSVLEKTAEEKWRSSCAGFPHTTGTMH